MKGEKMKHIVWMLSAVLLVMITCSCSRSPVTLKGQVETVGIRTGSPIIADASKPVMNAGVKASASRVVIFLQDHKSARYMIDLPRLLDMPEFSDLKEGAQGTGGLFILTPLQERLTGRQVELTFTKLGCEDGVQQYAISAIRIEK